jgi:putative transposase
VSFGRAKALCAPLEEALGGWSIHGREAGRLVRRARRMDLEIVERDREARDFEVLPKRWIVERTFSWLIRNRRLSKDYERLVQTSETFMEVAMIRMILRRLARGV